MNYRRAIILIVLAATFIRAAVVLHLDNRLYFPDSEHFIAMAQNVLDGHGPRVSEQTVANRGPGYAYFLAGIFAITGTTADAPPLTTIRLLQALFGGLLCLIVYLIGSTLYSKPAGLASAGIVALDPFLTYFTGLVLAETLFTLLLALALLMLLKTRDGAVLWAIAAGVVSGTAILVRPAMLLMLVPLVPAYLYANRFTRRALASALLFAACSLAILVPWGLRNHSLTGRFALTTLSSGASLYEGTYSGADGAPALDTLAGEIEAISCAHARWR